VSVGRRQSIYGTEQGKERQIRNHGKTHETGRRYNIKRAYPEKPEQPSGTRHTQYPKRQTFSSESVKERHAKKNSSNKKSKP
jgi:hypothetical protein